jgi:enoyl-CoA hydratase/carnithine racemase
VVDLDLVTVERVSNVAILRLNRGVTNPLSQEFLEHILRTVCDLRDDLEGIDALLITSNSDKFFSIGFDLPELHSSDIAAVKLFYETFNKLCLDLYSFPRPTIAGILGHAIAGGCILATCCDYRYIADGKKLMGLNEIKLGIPIPYISLVLLEQTLGERSAKMVVESGEFYGPEQLKLLGWVDEVLPSDQVVDRAVEFIRTISSYPKEALVLNQHKFKNDIREKIDANLDDDVQGFLACWETDEVQRLVAEAIKTF